MRRRRPQKADSTSYFQHNGTLNRGTGGGVNALGGQSSTPPKTNALLVEVDLVEIAPIAIDGSVTTVDGVASDGRIVLLTAQADPTQNGIYKAHDGVAWDLWNSDAHVDGMICNILEGDIYQDTTWRLATDNDIDRGTTPLTFYQFPYLDLSTAITSATPGVLNIPGGPVPGTFTPIPNVVWRDVGGGYPATDKLAPLHLGPNPAGGVFTFSGFRWSGNYEISCNILCNHPATSGTIYVAILRNGGLYQEIIRRSITIAEERHEGSTNITVDAIGGDVIDVVFYDPTGVGYGVTVQEAYVDIRAGDRR